MSTARKLSLFMILFYAGIPGSYLIAGTGQPEGEPGTTFRVYVILAIGIFLFGLFSGHDWSMFAFRTANLDNPELFSRYAKFLVTLSCTVMIWIAGQYAFDPEDTLRLVIAYSFMVLGDVIFFFNVHSRICVLSFATAHFPLIRRNAWGLSNLPQQSTAWLLLAGILAGMLILMVLLFWPKLKDNKPYFGLLTFYAIIIGGSVWAALVAFWTGFFPPANTILIAVGVICFFLSDVCVGYYRSLPKNYTMVFATYLTWIFYTPALFLTALSSYDPGRVF